VEKFLMDGPRKRKTVCHILLYDFEFGNTPHFR